jgi:hypothetical protein
MVSAHLQPCHERPTCYSGDGIAAATARQPSRILGYFGTHVHSSRSLWFEIRKLRANISPSEPRECSGERNLMSYRAEMSDLHGRALSTSSKFLHGIKPANLPVEQY